MTPPNGADSADQTQPSLRRMAELPINAAPAERTQPSVRTRRERARAEWPWWSVVSLLMLALIALACAGGSLVYAFRSAAPTARPTTVLVIVTQPGATPIAATSVPPTSIPWVSITRYARVSGTQGLSLRIRREPNTKAETVKLVPDGTRLLVIGDGRQADGLLWWPVRDPSDNQEGWAVSAYLVPDTGP